jgi:superfamily II DNA or RNA helicase
MTPFLCYIILMRFIMTNPTQAVVADATEADLKYLQKELSYSNTANAHLLKRHHSKAWLKKKNPEQWQAELEKLKADVHKTLIFKDKNGILYIRPGSIPHLNGEFEIENLIQYPIPRKIPWAKPLPFKLHPYQQASVEKLIEAKHANVELCTGAGKGAILLALCRETGFRTAIVAPSRSIFFELLEKFEHHLGKGNVGTFGAGKKKIGKKFTICIADSLANLEPDTEEWEFFSNLDMICVDESHTWGAETLEAVCHGVFYKVPYRFFMSGTQTRGDGSKKLLQSIIGRTAHRLSTKEAVDGGYICPHNFVIVELESSNPNFLNRDSIIMKRAHFLNNKNIAAFAAQVANSSALLKGEQTLVLVDELSQLSILLPLLKVPYAYAHSDSNRAKLEVLGLEPVDSAESVEKFNKNEVKVLVGTSCIATGTNIFPAHTTINWVGGTSEIRTKQGAVGRSVRMLSQNPWAAKCMPKPFCRIYDFNIRDVYIMQRHLEDRVEFYEDSGSEIKYITL